MDVIRVSVRNSQNGLTALMEVDQSTKIQDLLDSAVEFWSLPREPYLIRAGNRLIPGQKTVGEVGLREGEEIEILPDPEGG